MAAQEEVGETQRLLPAGQPPAPRIHFEEHGMNGAATEAIIDGEVISANEQGAATVQVRFKSNGELFGDRIT